MVAVLPCNLLRGTNYQCISFPFVLVRACITVVFRIAAMCYISTIPTGNSTYIPDLRFSEVLVSLFVVFILTSRSVPFEETKLTFACTPRGVRSDTQTLTLTHSWQPLLVVWWHTHVTTALPTPHSLTGTPISTFTLPHLHP